MFFCSFFSTGRPVSFSICECFWCQNGVNFKTNNSIVIGQAAVYLQKYYKEWNYYTYLGKQNVNESLWF